MSEEMDLDGSNSKRAVCGGQECMLWLPLTGLPVRLLQNPKDTVRPIRTLFQLQGKQAQ